MGMINFGIPEKIVLDLCAAHDVSVFVETGTYQGATAKWASAHFDQVHTIERSVSLFDNYGKPLSSLNGVTAYCGDSRDILPSIVNSIGNKRAIYWLDSHWFGGETAGEEDQCPLLGELACLLERGQDIILIDDARLILAAPPMPHKPSHWPTIADVIMALPVAPKPYVQVIDDVIFILPNEEPIKSRLIQYSKRRSNLFWKGYLEWKNLIVQTAVK